MFVSEDTETEGVWNTEQASHRHTQQYACVFCFPSSVVFCTPYAFFIRPDEKTPFTLLQGNDTIHTR